MHDDDTPAPGTLERLERAERLKLTGHHAEAIALLEELILEDPGNVSALEEIADNELSLDHFDRAETAARQAIALDKGSYTGHYILGFLHSHAERWEEALVCLCEANRLRPNNPEILRCLGWALFRRGEHVPGLATMERALNLDSDNALILCDLGVCHLELRHFSKARALFQRALDLEPANPRARECVAAIAHLELHVQDTPVDVKG